MISICFQGKLYKITVIRVYALISNAEETEVEQFYKNLQDLLELTPKKDVLFIIGDWNAKVGSQETPGVTGKFGLGVQNEAGQRLIGFFQEKALVIINTLFQQHERTLHVDITGWSIPKSDDYILCSQRWRSSVQSVITRTGADCDSDHELIIAKFILKLKKLGNTTRPFRSVQFSCSVMSDSLRPHEPQHIRPPCPSPTPGVHPNPCPLSYMSPCNHLIFCHPLLFLPSVFPSIRVFSNESALRIRWPMYWSFSFNNSPSNEHPGLIFSFGMEWLDLSAVQGTLRVFSNTTVQKQQFFSAQFSL